VVLGAVGMNIPREPFYMKEIELRLSRSYGPGRYDPNYEEKGQDYPFGYVRFTEQRNMYCFLELLENGRIDLNPIISHRFPIEEAPKAYELIHGTPQEDYIGILLEYNRKANAIPTKVEVNPKPLDGKMVLGVIGAGNYVKSHLLPHIKSRPEIIFGSICTATGMTALDVASKFGFRSAESRFDRIISESDAILIGTRHNDHARFAIEALKDGKSVFVEKPLVINLEELEEIVALVEGGASGTAMVGFNRRFSPATKLLKDHLGSVQMPKQFVIRVNAGAIPLDHWIQDLDVGGGRLIGEACHFIDLAVFLTQSEIASVSAVAIPRENRPPALWDDFNITLGMRNGSIGTIIYSSIGDKGIPKEHVEVFCNGRAGIIHDFKNIELWASGKVQKKKMPFQDKGQKRQMDNWINGLKKGVSPIPFAELINVHRACFAAIESFTTHEIIRI
jgi:polar amino acid transport system substrate-binding protein